MTYDACMATLVLTVIGDDRAGLVNAVAEVISSHGGNWERSQMAELAGKFAGIVVATVPDDRSVELIAALEPLQGMLDVTAQVAGPEVPHQATTVISLDLVGTDRPGIVSDITRVLTEHGVNIDSFATMTRDAPMAGGMLFEAAAELEITPSVDLISLQHSLEQLANELMVDLTLEA
jgi:glycine cleavage system regulatory protein